LSQNELVSVISGLFANLGATLTDISLDRNRITSVAESAFNGLVLLRSLCVSPSCPLSDVPSNLASNLVSSLPSGVFDGLVSLAFLDLSNNLLIGLPSLVDLTDLRVLFDTAFYVCSDQADRRTTIGSRRWAPMASRV
jgi:hypothetical protein